ncbi:MAG TPA: glycosyl hydrolase family 18 protein [Solirubrobacteraceae bacterium]|nr:glycosyl hydrolase family 18 protein [Solirubrobacteraceae bacterium]
MKSLAVGTAALAVALSLMGCSGSLMGASASAPQPLTVTLPTLAPADATIPAPQADTAGRRIHGRDPQSALTGSAPSAALASDGTAAATASPNTRPGTAATASPGTRPGAAATAAPSPPLTPAANARLDGASVWIPYWNLAAGVATATQHASIVKVAHPFLYELTGRDTLVDQSGGAAPSTIATLHAAHLTVIPTVTETAQMATFLATLRHPRRETAVLHTLVALADQPDVDGVDLDFENLAIGSGSARQAGALAQLYPRFVARLCVTLHALGRSCEVTVMAKNTRGQLGGGGLDTRVYDYAALGAIADRVQIMAYDDHVPSGAAGPVAPWPWVQSVLAYALTQIPAGKIVLGVPAYGYEWSSNGDNTSLTATSAEALAQREHAAVRWSSVDAEPTFAFRTGRRRHRVHHVVWFEDATANYDRAVLAADDKLAGIDLWAAGDEDPSTWTMLARLAAP